MPVALLALPCFWPHFCGFALICGLCFCSNAIHMQAAHDNTIYIVTEGRFLNHVDLDYVLPNPMLGICSSKVVTKGFYLDIDEVNVSAYRGGVKPSCEPCKCLMNPDDIPFIHIGRDYQYPFSVNSVEERDEIVLLINKLKTRRDNAKIGGGGGGGGAVAKTSKRVFVASASDPTNFSLFMIESDNWASFVLQMKEKFALSSINSVQIAEVNVTVSSIAEISANDKLLIN